jgi:hypothetical protein
VGRPRIPSRTPTTPAPTYAGTLTTATWSSAARVLVTRRRSGDQRLPPGTSAKPTLKPSGTPSRARARTSLPIMVSETSHSPQAASACAGRCGRRPPRPSPGWRSSSGSLVWRRTRPARPWMGSGTSSGHSSSSCWAYLDRGRVLGKDRRAERPGGLGGLPGQDLVTTGAGAVPLPSQVVQQRHGATSSIPT